MVKVLALVSVFCCVAPAAVLADEEAPAARQYIEDSLSFMAREHPDKIPAVISAAKRNACPVIWDPDKSPKDGPSPPMC